MIEAVLASPSRRHVRSLLVVPGDGEGGIGQGRADEIAVSVLLPFCAALAPGSRDWSALFAEYYAPPSNRWTRLMVEVFSHAGHQIRVRTALQHQGLHHLYHEHCRPQKAEGCSMECRLDAFAEADVEPVAR